MVEESSGGEERLWGEPSADDWTGCLGNDCFPQQQVIILTLTQLFLGCETRTERTYPEP